MKAKIKKLMPYIYKIAIVVAIASLYNFIFSDFFDVYEPAWYVICATFLTIVYIKKNII